MTSTARLEQAYRRLLAWYPQPFRREQQEEMLGVLMAGAREGQQRPGLIESADLIRGAIVMRLRRFGSRSAGRPWAGALAVFSVAAPLFLLAVDILAAVLPYRLPPGTTVRPTFAGLVGRHPVIGGLPLFHDPGFLAATGCEGLVAVLVLLGFRRLALAATGIPFLYWAGARYGFPSLLTLLAISGCMLEAAALTASPGPRRGRQLMNWRHAAVLLPAAAAVHFSLIAYDLAHLSPWLTFAGPKPDSTGYLMISVALTAAATGLALALRMDGYLLLFFAAMLYPCTVQMIATATGSPRFLFAYPVTLGHVALLCLPPLLLACWAVLTVVLPPRFRQPAPD